jgi:Skp family chaperone for outer membrane proteins
VFRPGAAVFAAAVLIACGCGSQRLASLIPSGSAVGYVDVDKVVAAHPLHGELQSLEGQIAVLNAQAASEPQAVTPEQRAAQAALERDLQTAETQFESELNARQAYYRRQLQQAVSQIQAGAIGTDQSGSILGGMQQQFNSQMQQLQASGARTLDAYRTALFKEDTDHLRSVQELLGADVRAKIRARSSELAAKETAYQVQLAHQDQDQRLNLKTELENLSLTPQQRSQDAAQLQDIETREEYLTNQLKTKDNADLTAYENQLQKDAATRFAAERDTTEKRTQAKLVARQNELSDQFHVQANAMGGKFNQQLAEANKSLSSNPKVQAQLQTVQTQTQARYEADAAQVMSAYQQTRKSLVDKYSAIAHMQFQDDQAIQSQIDGIAQARRDLYNQILDQVQDQVKTVAQARGVAIVFDTVAGAGNAVDLTDQVAKAVAALPAATPAPTPSGG